MLPLKIAGLGVYFPNNRETKEDFVLRGVPEDVIEKLGVYERRVVVKGQTAADLELEAARKAIENAGMTPSDIDLIISAAIQPEMIGIPNSSLLQHRLGALHTAAFDIGQACSSMIPGLLIAANFIANGQYQRILLTASTIWSVVSDPAQPSADFVLGDGAAAVVLTASQPGYGIISSYMRTDGRFFYNCGFRVGHDHNFKYYDQHNSKLLFYIDNSGVDNSRSAFKDFLAAMLPDAFNAALGKTTLSPADIDCVIIHGNVKPLAEAWIQGMEIPPERFPLTYERYGNLSAPTILVNMQEGLNRGMIKNGDTVAIVSGGGGFSAGAIIMRWEA